MENKEEEKEDEIEYGNKKKCYAGDCNDSLIPLLLLNKVTVAACFLPSLLLQYYTLDSKVHILTVLYGSALESVV